MSPRRSAATVVACCALAAPLTACSSDDNQVPEDAPRPMSARVISDGESKTYGLTVCSRDNDESLVTGGTDGIAELLVINIAGGNGDVTVLDQTETPALAGEASSYEIDDDLEFEITGTLESGEGDFRVWGSCAEDPDAQQ